MKVNREVGRNMRSEDRGDSRRIMLIRNDARNNCFRRQTRDRNRFIVVIVFFLVHICARKRGLNKGLKEEAGEMSAGWSFSRFLSTVRLFHCVLRCARRINVNRFLWPQRWCTSLIFPGYTYGCVFSQWLSHVSRTKIYSLWKQWRCGLALCHIVVPARSTIVTWHFTRTARDIAC